MAIQCIAFDGFLIIELGMCRFLMRYMLIVCKVPLTPMVVTMRVLTFHPRAMVAYPGSLIYMLLFYLDGEVRYGY